MYNLYSYDGPVMEFDRCVADRWKAQTKAETERKARSNLAYQFKSSTNRAAHARITLPGKIVMVNQ